LVGLCVSSIDARAFLIDATALVTELLVASASHVVAALGLLDPELAEGALLELGAPYELVELPITVFFRLQVLELLATDALVEGSTTVETEVACALLAEVLLVVPPL
jgi:hypothetical protein